MPNIDEISNAYAEFVTYSPLDLKPQISLDQELGWHGKFDKTRTRARLFRSYYKNEIAYDRAAYVDLAGGYYVGSNINFDRTQRQGVDLSLNHSLSPELTLGTSATYQQAQFTSDNFKGKKIPLSPETILSANANWRFEAKQTIRFCNSLPCRRQVYGSSHIGQHAALLPSGSNLSFGRWRCGGGRLAPRI
jgi:outer membrane receptor for ferrienterochelin and colicin